jgi:hypothetical protein
MRNIAIRKDGLINKIFREQARKFLFWVDGNALGIMGPGQQRRIDSVSYEGNLGSSESHHPVRGTLSKVSVEIMKIPSSSSENDHPNGFF